MQIHNRALQGVPLGERADEPPVLISPEFLLGFIRRQWLLVVLFGIVGALAGVAVILSAVPLYTSQISVLIDQENSQVVDQLSTIGGAADGEPAVMSQVELLKSDAIGYAVVDKLNLLNDPEFNASSASVWSLLKSGLKTVTNLGGMASPAAPASTDHANRAAVTRLVSNMEVERVPRTYVLEISYTSPSASLSAKVANAIGEAYLLDKLNSRYEATRRASVWLQDRISELRQKALDSDLAVQRFRATNGLLSTGTRLVSDQQLSELNTALISARTATSQVRARLERIEQITASGGSDAIVSDVLDSSISNELRKKYLDASKLEAQISGRLGTNHTQAIRLRNEMAEYKRLMFDELNRIAESYRSELDVAVARERNLTESVEHASGVSAAANETQVQVRELEREAESYRALYQVFLQRYQEAVQQQSFPVTAARIISRAVPSAGPSAPRKVPIFILCCMIGIGAGAAVSVFREFRDRYFRTGEQVRDLLRLEFLGSVPSLEMSKGSGGEIFNGGAVQGGPSLTNYVLDYPLSSFAETLRSAKIAIDVTAGTQKCRVVGVTSTIPGEGKSTVAINLAQLLAGLGLRVVLIDADLRNPGATRAVGVNAEVGLIETLTERSDVRRALIVDPRTRLRFLPAVTKRRISHSAEFLTSQPMREVLAILAAESDYVILDLPPVGPVVDARAVAGYVDSFLYVVEWGGTARRVVKQTLETEVAVREKCIGVVLNKVDGNKMKLYQGFGSSEYYQSQYAKYYHNNDA